MTTLFRLLSALFLLYILLGAGSITFSQVYLINESFESTTPPPPGWVYATGVTHSTVQALSGVHSARFAANDHSIRSPLLTTPEALSFWLYRTPGGNLNVQVQWHTDPNATNWNTIATIQGSNNNWIQYTTDIPSNPDFTTKTNIYIRIRSNSGGRTFFIDDFTVTSTGPVPDFETNPTEATTGQNIVFTDLSQGSVSSWFWDFGAGADPSTAATKGPHNISYSNAGLKTVSLTVNGSFTETKTDYIAVSASLHSVSATYTAGDIPTDFGFQLLPGQSTCPGTLTVNIPANATIAGVNVNYDMTAQNWGWKSEQRSQLRCVSPGGTSETTLSQGSDNEEGVYSYSRTGLDIANGVTSGGNILFELHTGRTWGGSGCNTYYNKVDNNTWTVTVHYAEVPYANFTANPLACEPAESVTFTDNSGGWSFSSWDWDFGEGADPATASAQGPHAVTYSTTGYKTVSLMVDGIHTETKVDYIHVTDPLQNPFNPPRHLSAGVVNGNTVTLDWHSPEINEGFESYTDFSLSFGNWTQHDLDEDATWGSAEYEFPNEYYTGSFIIFNPSQTTPPATDPDWQPNSGDKFAACFAANAGPNDDWLITPQLKIAPGDELSFYHKSVTDLYGLERFRVGISITSSDPADFTIITPSPYLESPSTWTEFTYNLSAYADQEIYIAINCISDDAFVFMLDDFVISDENSSLKYSLAFNGRSESHDSPQKSSLQRKSRPDNHITQPSHPKSSRLFATYKIYRNLIEIDQVSGFTFTELNVPPGLHYYHATAVYTNPYGESDASNIAEVLIGESWLWTGSVSAAWENNNNWNTLALPVTSSDVVIPLTPNHPVISSHVVINDLEIEQDAILTIETQGSLTVNGVISNNEGETGLMIASSASGTGSLIHNTNNLPATFQRYISGAPETWHLLSSPVSNQEIIGDFTPSGGSNPYGDSTRYDFYLWHEPDTSWIYLLNTEYLPTWAQAHSSNNFIPGMGYLVSYLDENPTHAFSGLLNNGEVNIAVSKSGNTATQFGANLLGNPYPSSVDWKADAGWNRTDLELSEGGYDIWIWSDEANNYGVYNSASVADEGTLGLTRFIPPTQGFFVSASQNGNISINNAARVHEGAGNWLKGISRFTQLLHIVAISVEGSSTDEVLIEFDKPHAEGGTIKKFSFMPHAPSLFIPNNGQFYSMQFLESPELRPVIPLSFKAGKDGIYVLTFNFDPDFFEMIELHDLKTGIRQNLKDIPGYEFIAAANDKAGRFVLQFIPGHYANPHDALPVQIYAYNKVLYLDLQLLQGRYLFETFDAGGRNIMRETLYGGEIYERRFQNSGLLITRISGAEGTLVKKIILF
jgi:PKD repeat protein